MTRKCFSNPSSKYANLLHSERYTQDSIHQQQHSEIYLTTFRNKIHYSMHRRKNSDIIVFWGGAIRGNRA